MEGADKLDIYEFKNKIFEKAEQEGFSKYDIYYNQFQGFSVSVYKAEVEKYQNNSSLGVSFRGEYNGSVGYAYSERLDIKAIDELIENAKQNAQIISSDEKEIIYEGDKSYPKLKLFNEESEKVSVEDKIKMALKMEQAVLNYDSRIKSCNRASVSNYSSYTYLANSFGLELKQKRNQIVAYASAMAQQGEQTKTMGEIKFCFDFSDIDPVEIGRSAAKKAVDSLGAASVKSGKYKVIIQNEAFIDLFSAFLGAFFAENVQKGLSLLKGKINKKIASDIVNIADEPLLENGLGSTAFDSEAVASFNKTVVENGILKTYLYNLKAAEKDGVKSTGNGFRGSFKGSVSTSVTNFYIKGSKTDINEIISGIDDGILITDLSGLHSGTNSVSGDFSLACSGFYIREGKTAEPVEQITAAGNFFDIMNKIKNIGSDLKFSGNIGSPSVMIDEIDIAGL